MKKLKEFFCKVIKSKKSSLLSAFVITFTIMLSMSMYQHNITTLLGDSVESTITEVSKQQEHSLEYYLKSKRNLVFDISETILSITDGGDIDSHIDELVNYLKTSQFSISLDNIYISFENNDVVSAQGIITHDFDVHFTSEDNFVSNLTVSPTTGEDVIFYSQPLVDSDGEFIGDVVIETAAEDIQPVLFSSFHSSGITMILDSQGKVMFTTDNDDGVVPGLNIEDLFAKVTFNDNISVDHLHDIINSGSKQGYMSYSIESEKRYFVFTFMDSADWILFVAAPEATISQYANSIIFNSTLFLIEITIILLIIWLRIIHLNKVHVKELAQVAYYDELTGLMNEKKFKIEVKKALLEKTNTAFTIVKLDIINFKVVNKIFGYVIGDAIIKAVAESNLVTAKGIILSRIGADEFLLFGEKEKLKNLDMIKNVYEKDISQKIVEICNRKFKFRYSRYLIPLGETNADDVVDTIALTHSFCKNKMFEGIYDYDDNLKNQLIRTAFICDRMHKALINREFKVYLQPKYNLSDNSIFGAEALVRWQQANGEFIYPNEFIPIFEQEGFILELDKYMLKEVCSIIKRFEQSGYPQIPISINFSRLHMSDENFADMLTEIVDINQVPRQLVEIEMTETSMISNAESFKKLFNELHQRGFTLSMDDFGAGYSSFALLSDLNFDVIKIDKSLIDEVGSSNKRELVLRTIINMSKSLNLITVCEGVETQQQIDFIKEAGCEVAQGYFYAKPMPNEDFENLLIQE